jgi:hypothetical protein
MKVKSWHVVCLLVVVAAALYFLVSVREGMDDPKCPAGAPGISSVTLTGGQKVRLYTQSECSAMGGNFAANGQKNWGMANDSVGECLGTSNGINVGFCNQEAPPSAAAKASISPLPPPVLTGTWKVNGTNYNGKISQSGDTWTLTPTSTESGWSLISGKFDPGSPTSGSLVYTTPGGPLNMTFTIDSAGTTITGSNGGSFTKMPDTPPMAAAAPPPAAATPAASMTPSVPAPSPAQSAATTPAYSLSCMAAPVSGMKGSVGMPETPAAWNVNQPPSGWNSKNGYTTGGWRK